MKNTNIDEIAESVSAVKTPVNWEEVAEKWQFVANRRKDIITGLLQQHDEETGMIDVRPNPSCPICTHGVTPNSLNKGLCFYHQAQQEITA